MHFRSCIGDVARPQIEAITPRLVLGGLQLDNTQVDDDGLSDLTDIKELSFVSLRGTKVTQTAIDALKKERPNLSIAH